MGMAHNTPEVASVRQLDLEIRRQRKVPLEIPLEEYLPKTFLQTPKAFGSGSGAFYLKGPKRKEMAEEGLRSCGSIIPHGEVSLADCKKAFKRGRRRGTLPGQHGALRIPVVLELSSERLDEITQFRVSRKIEPHGRKKRFPSRRFYTTFFQNNSSFDFNPSKNYTTKGRGSIGYGDIAPFRFCLRYQGEKV